MEPSEFHEYKIMHFTMQLLGMAPSVLGPTHDQCTVNKLLVAYNIVFSVLIIVNVYFSEEDPANNGSYSNKTPVVDTVFTVVDWLGNVYIVANMLLSIYTTKRTCAVYFETIKLNQRFKIMGIVFNKRKNLILFLVIMVIGVLCPFSAIALAVTLEENAGNVYTNLYWVTVSYPVVVSSIMLFIFATWAINVYQKLWAVNEVLRTMIEDYCHRKYSVNSRLLNVNLGVATYEKSLEDLIFARITSAIPPKTKLAFHDQLTLQTNSRKSKPFFVFIDNFPDCFNQRDGDMVEQLHSLRETHFAITEVTEILGDFFGPHFLFLFTWYFFQVIINIYASVTFQVTGSIDNEYGVNIMWSIYWVCMALLPVAYCNVAASEAKQALTLVHKFWSKLYDNMPAKFELQSFAMQIAHNPLQFTAYGFFNVNSSLIFSFAVGIIGNVIFIIQFDKLNLNAAAKD